MSSVAKVDGKISKYKHISSNASEEKFPILTNSLVFKLEHSLRTSSIDWTQVPFNSPVATST